MKKHLGIKNIRPKVVVQRTPYLVMKTVGSCHGSLQCKLLIAMTKFLRAKINQGKGWFVLACSFKGCHPSLGWETVRDEGKNVKWLLPSCPPATGRDMNACTYWPSCS